MQIQIIVQMYITAFAIRNLRLNLYSMLRRKLKVTPEAAVRDAYGKRMIFNGVERDDMYFDQFNKMWN
ncbi:unnamed protein product, partial [Mesorhabditis spiculigera]